MFRPPVPNQQIIRAGHGSIEENLYLLYLEFLLPGLLHALSWAYFCPLYLTDNCIDYCVWIRITTYHI